MSVTRLSPHASGPRATLLATWLDLPSAWAPPLAGWSAVGAAGWSAVVTAGWTVFTARPRHVGILYPDCAALAELAHHARPPRTQVETEDGVVFQKAGAGGAGGEIFENEFSGMITDEEKGRLAYEYSMEAVRDYL